MPAKSTGAGPRKAAGAARVRRAAPPRPSPLADSNLRLIWKEQRISRADIARRTGLSRSTVSEIVDSLFSTGLIGEVGVGPSRGGRPPIVLEFKDDARAILGVDMGAAHVSVALTNLRGKILAWEHRSHPVRSDPRGTRALVRELSELCLAGWRHGARRLVGIGIAVPCPVDPEHPDRFPEVVLPEWHGRSGLDTLSRHFGVPMLVDNDANLGALAERWWGAGRGIDDFAYIKLATGLGMGHVIRGEIYRGASGFAGEIGHMAIDPQGGPCICGLRGCLATLVGAQALVSRAKELRVDHPGSVLARGELSIEGIEDAALAGDPLALALVNESAEHLGTAVASLLNLMNPALVVLGGGLSRLGDVLLKPLRQVVRRRTLISSLVACEIRTSELGTRATAVGAATMVLEALLADSSMFPASARKGMA